MVMSLVWHVFEPLLFGLVGAEVSVEYMNSKVFGELLQWNIRQDVGHEATTCINFVPKPSKVNSLSLLSQKPTVSPCVSNGSKLIFVYFDFLNISLH